MDASVCAGSDCSAGKPRRCWMGRCRRPHFEVSDAQQCNARQMAQQAHLATCAGRSSSTGRIGDQKQFFLSFGFGLSWGLRSGKSPRWLSLKTGIGASRTTDGAAGCPDSGFNLPVERLASLPNDSAVCKPRRIVPGGVVQEFRGQLTTMLHSPCSRDVGSCSAAAQAQTSLIIQT